MHSARHETDSARLALYSQALALVTSLLSPLLGPFASIPAVALGHIARWCWRLSHSENRGGTTLIALIVGYSFLVSAVLSPFASIFYCLLSGEEVSIGVLIAIYWVLGGIGVVGSFFVYMFAIESRAMINAATVIMLAGFGLCLTSMAIARSRERARMQLCGDNMREIGLHMHMKMQRDPNWEFEHLGAQAELWKVDSEAFEFGDGFRRPQDAKTAEGWATPLQTAR